jgi:HAD superfamily hydrolase (TIGR01549 family)
MIRALLLDWVGTLAHPEPDRQVVLSRVAQELGVTLPVDRLPRGIHAAEDVIPAGVPARWREGAAEAPFLRWWQVLTAEIGVTLSPETMLELTKRASRAARSARWALYDDVLPALGKYKARGLTLGLISNLVLEGAGTGLDAYLDFVVTSKEVGADKPEPAIFLAALERAKAKPSEAIYVGDQYQLDVVGARRVGIAPVLIDRDEIATGAVDCPRIRSLAELERLL